nr:MAG TPA: hypothetical protein [Caudoviricetes sp.]
MRTFLCICGNFAAFLHFTCRLYGLLVKFASSPYTLSHTTLIDLLHAYN